MKPTLFINSLKNQVVALAGMLVLSLTSTTAPLMAQTDTRTTAGDLTVTMRPVVSSDLDSLYINIYCLQTSGSVSTLGNADFPIYADPTTRAVINYSNILTSAIVRRGVFDSARSPFYLPMTFVQGVGGDFHVLRVRLRPTTSNVPVGGYPFLSAVPGNQTLIATLGFPIIDCKGSPSLAWFRRNNAPISGTRQAVVAGIVNPFLANQRWNVIYDDAQARNIQFRPRLNTPVATTQSLPQNVLFVWNQVRNAVIYAGEFTNRRTGARTYVEIGNQTSYRFFTQPGDTICGRIIARGQGCPGDRRGDSTVSEEVCGVATNCPLFTIARNNVRPAADTSICPTSSVTVRLDTNTLTTRFLGRTPLFSFDGGRTFINEPFITVRLTKDSTFTVTYLDANRCGTQGTASVTVRLRTLVDPATRITVVAAPTACNRNILVISYTGVGDALEYRWTTNGRGRFIDANGNPIANPTGNPVSYRPLADEVGNVIFTATNTCYGISSSDTTNFSQGPTASFTASPLVGQPNVLEAGKDVIFTVRNAQAGESYSWDFGDNTPEVTVTAPSVQHTYNRLGNVNVRLRVTAANGCSTDTIKAFEVKSFTTFYVPNVFSPLATDGNQYFRISGSGILDGSFELKVYDRWGKVVYTATSFTEARTVGWDGRRDNAGEMLPPDSYTYTVKGRYISGVEISQTGTITLVR